MANVPETVRFPLQEEKIKSRNHKELVEYMKNLVRALEDEYADTAAIINENQPGAPAAHHESHEDGGSDEVSVQGLSGELADPQPPKIHNHDDRYFTETELGGTAIDLADHNTRHEDGGADEMNVAGLSGELADPQPPKAHTLASHSSKNHSELDGVTSDQHHAEAHTLASHSSKNHTELDGVTTDQHHNQDHHLRHEDGGADELSVAGLSGELADPQPPKAHTLASHSSKNHSELDGVTTDQHHAQAHTLASHSTKAHSELDGVTTDQHHAQDHHARHENGGADEISVQGLSGVLADGQSAAKLQTRNIDPAAPSDGQVLTWDQPNTKWKPANPGGGGTASYPPGYRDGCRPKYKTASDIYITAGAIEIDGYRAILSSNLTVTWSDLDTGSETGSTWYYLYLVKPATDGGAPTAKISVTAPGSDRYHPSQSTWRCVGSFYNNSATNIDPMYYTNDGWTHNYLAIASLTGGAATSRTSVTLHVPAWAKRVHGQVLYDTGGSGINYVEIYTMATGTFWGKIGGKQTAYAEPQPGLFFDLYFMTARTIWYITTNANATVNIYTLGYWEDV